MLSEGTARYMLGKGPLHCDRDHSTPGRQSGSGTSRKLPRSQPKPISGGVLKTNVAAQLYGTVVLIVYLLSRITKPENVALASAFLFQP